MGKQKLCIGVLLGAIAGGAAALFDRETRYYAKNKLQSAKSSTSYMLKHPTETLRQVQQISNEFNEKFNSNADNVINALDQVEETWSKISRKEPEKLETTK